MSLSLASQIQSVLHPDLCSQEVYQKFLTRLAQGNLTRAKNHLSHACVYFAAYDPDARQVFLGHHIKSGLWLFTGGHVDPGETLQASVSREIWEEWGLRVPPEETGVPALFTITTIDQPHYPCREHFDVWYFYPVKKDQFTVDWERLRTEFFQNQWMATDEAWRVVVDPSTLRALSIISKFE